MKTVLSQTKIGATCAALLCATFFASVASAATPSIHLCAGSSVVPITTMKPLLPNGRGPLMSVQIGTKTVCRTCPVTTIVTKNSLPNGKGAQSSAEVTKTGLEHVCTTCAVGTKL